MSWRGQGCIKADTRPDCLVIYSLNGQIRAVAQGAIGPGKTTCNTDASIRFDWAGTFAVRYDGLPLWSVIVYLRLTCPTPRRFMPVMSKTLRPLTRFYAHAPTVEQVSRLAGEVTPRSLVAARRDGGFARPEPGVWRRQGGRGQPGSLGGRGGGDRYGPAGRPIFGSRLHHLQGGHGAAAGRGFDGCGNSGRGDFLAGGRGPRPGRGESLLLADARGTCAVGACAGGHCQPSRGECSAGRRGDGAGGAGRRDDGRARPGKRFCRRLRNAISRAKPTARRSAS